MSTIHFLSQVFWTMWMILTPCSHILLLLSVMASLSKVNIRATLPHRLRYGYIFGLIALAIWICVIILFVVTRISRTASLLRVSTLEAIKLSIGGRSLGYDLGMFAMIAIVNVVSVSICWLWSRDLRRAPQRRDMVGE